MVENNILELELLYDNVIGGHLANKPIYDVSMIEEKCICVTHKKVKVCDVFSNDKPNKLIQHSIIFNKLEDRNIFISLDLFTKEDDSSPDKRYRGEWGYQIVLIDEGDYYLLEYQDGFITGDARGGDDFQNLTSDWQF